MGTMRLEGWNHVPRGYGATFDIGSAPWWLRAWFRTPFVDRFAYRVLVDRGLGWLTVQPGSPSYSRDEACTLLARDPSMIASFSRALLEGLSADQSDEQFDEQLDTSIEQISAP